jgi:cell division septation protein DedD
MNLSIHLYELLKSNDCVIVPDLGGFIANFQPSRYDPQGDHFSPPSKEIIFSGKLKRNDGLLVNYIGEKEGVGYLEARKIVSEFVSECHYKLGNGERIAFEKIGTLNFDGNDLLVFEAEQGFNIRLDTFGLDSFHFPQLVNKHTQPIKPIFRDKDPEPQKRNRPVVKYLLIGLPILAILYFIPLNKKLKLGETRNQPITNTASLTVSDTPAPLTSDVLVESQLVASEPNVETKLASKDVKEAAMSTEPVRLTDPSAANLKLPEPTSTFPEKTFVLQNSSQRSIGKFHVVGGCFKIKENANKQVEWLIKKGYPAVVSVMGGGFYRVSVESYQTRKEAEQGLVNILEVDPETSYWLMADKK